MRLERASSSGELDLGLKPDLGIIVIVLRPLADVYPGSSLNKCILTMEPEEQATGQQHLGAQTGPVFQYTACRLTSQRRIGWLEMRRLEAAGCAYDQFFRHDMVSTLEKPCQPSPQSHGAPILLEHNGLGRSVDDRLHLERVTKATQSSYRRVTVSGARAWNIVKLANGSEPGVPR